MKTSQNLFNIFLFLGFGVPGAFSQTRRSLDMQKYSTNTRRFYDHRGGFRKNTVKIQPA
jgi:peroxiredoxin